MTDVVLDQVEFGEFSVFAGATERAKTGRGAASSRLKEPGTFSDKEELAGRIAIESRPHVSPTTRDHGVRSCLLPQAAE